MEVNIEQVASMDYSFPIVGVFLYSFAGVGIAWRFIKLKNVGKQVFFLAPLLGVMYLVSDYGEFYSIRQQMAVREPIEISGTLKSMRQYQQQYNLEVGREEYVFLRVYGNCLNILENRKRIREGEVVYIEAYDLDKTSLFGKAYCMTRFSSQYFVEGYQGNPTRSGGRTGR